MENFLNRESPASLPEQIAGIIRQRIQSSVYQPGKKIDSIRTLSAELKVSPVTVIRALELLEKSGTVFSLPGKGVFVSKKFNLHERALTACFALPEPDIRKIRDAENRALSNEFYRGLIQGAMEKNIKLQFSYFASDPSLEQLLQQLKETENYDFMIFSSFQFPHLMAETAAKMPTFSICGSRTTVFPENVHVSDYDRPDARNKLFQLFLDSNCKSAATVSTGTNSRQGKRFSAPGGGSRKDHAG